MKFKKLVSIILVFLMVSLLIVGCGSNSNANKSSSNGTKTTTTTENTVKPGEATPRSETLYISGLQWGPPTTFNPLSPSQTSLPLSATSIARELTFETLFMYNQLDGKMYPLLGKSYAFSSDSTVCTVTLNPDAKWNDGEKVTADDVVYTFELGKKYPVSWSSNWNYLDSVTAKDDTTVEFKLKSDNKNPLMVEEALESVYILPKHVWIKIEEKDNNDFSKISSEVNANPVASGPYKVFYYDNAKVVLIRDDNYWGKAPSMWGKLPAPKYIVHNIFKDNAAGDTALRQNQVDVSQQFTPNIQTFGSNIKTYLSKPPYYMPGVIPWLVINVTKPGLDNANVRRAIAMAIDYDKIAKNAMSGYSGKMSPSLMLPLDSEQKLVDQSQLAPLQWKSHDIDGANALLDSIGAKKGPDGIRVLNGQKLSFKVECPTGWSDWNAALEIVASSCKEIGINVQTYFPQQSVWNNDMQTGNFDMGMYSYQGIGISSPWARAYQGMSSNGYAPIGQTAYFNYGRYKNSEVDTLLNQIPNITDETQLKDAWTKLNEIYLKEVPMIGLMYRPADFYTVNTSVWSGFPVDGDGTNIPPNICMDGYGIAALYKIHSSK
ncbi:extracellular solute-binding protein family 5 [Thermoanaerobacterium thermosaccharolyticum DSM 571]|uniref:Extracellular solute-binding protein family 5 n=1 Tax=Thermoanaerobacterium thermosaccharolyticum (strain ATCC 7956 / DSM 571 / NCIMB 9385 / NCA 3814 / NCTC 13789 / WDCM 00135 / 2032) TaxID=580327 RepID=D9TPU5_THETC|nr:ABC transporter substrate-binding protein [Thermoanaerobacterium thermosaccharolyticum]ADL69114.1 extracellular solute-binding protein family 5 [Thermoanaerobacterium thermosaccharolyticum DSM 571]